MRKKKKSTLINFYVEPHLTFLCPLLILKKGSILFDVGEVRQHLFCIKKYRKDTLKSFRINLANKFIGGFKM
ncbi:hypothetical protein ACFC37_04790, partial [Enterococcus durans]